MEIETKEQLLPPEIDGIAWLGQRRKWTGIVTVTRRSPKIYDLEVIGLWFKRECLCEFWAMGIFGVGRSYPDSGFVQNLPEATVNMEFDRVLKMAASKPLFSKQLISAIWSVWGDVSPDVGRCSNAEAIETVLDADRLASFGHEAEYEELKWLDRWFGPENVSAALARQVRLV